MADEQDMTVAEAAEAFEAFRLEVGSKAHSFVCLDRARDAFSGAVACSLQPRGILDKWTIRVAAPTFRELLKAIRSAWEIAADSNAAKTTHEMALKIIELTTTLGECTDASLRQHFEPRDVERYGEAACQAANDMAGRGPFEIVRMGGSNAEAA